MKKAFSIVIALVLICTLAAPAMAASAPKPILVEGFSFHCNDIEGGGNGRTYIEGQDKDYGKFDKKTGAGLIELVAVTSDPTGKTWEPKGDLGACTSCGRSDWVSFSNKSGTPDGKNIQFQHDGPSKRYINIKVIYNVVIPACEFTCVNADAKCNFDCDGCGECEFMTRGIVHDCGLICGIDHDCPFEDEYLDLTCGTVCECAKVFSRTIEDKKVLIKIADGILFEYTALDTWEGGNLFSGSPISELLFNSKTYNVFYVGAGACVCECEEVSCDAACVPCKFEPEEDDCDHEWLCDSCNGYWYNHCQHDNRCSDGDTPNNGNYNYFCAFCEIKNKDGGWKIGDAGRPICYASLGNCAWTGEDPCPNCN